jgi:putative transposase
MAESLFAVLECEFVNRRSFRDPDDARGAVLEFIDGWYTPRRRYSTIGQRPSIRYFRRYEQASASKPETLH